MMWNYFKNLSGKRVAITLLSVIGMGFFLAFLKYVDFGTDPYSVMNFAIADTLGWSIGNWQLVFNVLIFIPVILWGRDQIGLGTVFNMVLIGYTVDATTWLMEQVGFPALLQYDVLRWGVMLIALVAFIFSAATYMSAGLGTAPYDAIAIMIAHKLPKTPFWIIRLLYDLTATAIGLLFGGKLGVVTVLMVIFLGTAVDLVSKKVFKRKV